MNGPIDDRDELRAARAREPGTEAPRYRGGKALGRIRYFETQRGLPETTIADGLVSAAAAKAPVISARAPSRHRAAKSGLYAKAHKAKVGLIPSFAASAQLPVWRTLGPRSIPKGQTYGTGGNNTPPVSGRCVGIAVSPSDPRHLALCSAGGGLWGSSDQGASWQPLTDRQPTLSMGAIAVAPGSPNIMYAGTGEGDTISQLGVGLLRSSDGGQTWLHVPSNDLSGTGIYDIAVDPANAMHVWVATTEKLLESKDGGATWRVVQPVTAWDISINPTNPAEILVASAAGLIRSANGGTTWALVALPGTTSATRYDRMEVCHAPSSPAVVVAAAVFGGHGALWRRATAAGAFAAENGPPLKPKSDINQAWYDWCLAVSPANPNVVFLGAVELYKGTRSTAGWQWQNVSSRSSGDSIHPDQHHVGFDPSDPNVVYACNDGGVFRSPDGGTSWKSLNPGLSISEFEFIVQRESQDEWVIGGTQDNGTLGDATGGRWDQIALGDGGDCGADDPQNLCYHSYYEMPIERAPASGPAAFHWVDVSPPVPDQYDSLFYPPMDVVGKVVAKAGVTLFVSDNNGDSWEQVDFGGGGQKASAVVIYSANTIFVGTEDGRVIRVKRASGGWAGATVTALASPRQGYVSDIVIPGAVTKIVWASVSAFGGGHVFRSTNGGKSWTNRTSNLPDIPVNAIVVDPKDHTHIYAATDNGVYRTRNSGTTWAGFSNGLPNAVVGDLILHERRRLLRAGTRSRGAWEVAI